jgi:MoxR-like ATPase
MHDVRALNELVAKESAFIDNLVTEVGKVIVGQTYMIERILIGLFTGGHVLLEGVPGLAKTLMIHTLADALNLSFHRIQFTPDMMPSDITGTYPLPQPFVVMATQNPIEQEGTYRLPEAQIDRFMLMVKVGYPARAEERQIIDRTTGAVDAKASKVTTPEELLTARKVVRDVYMDDRVKDYIVDVVFATREPQKRGMKDLSPFIEYGASPRASIALNLAARAHAFLRHRGYVTPEDVKAVGPDVLRHRMVLSYEAEAEEVTAEDIVRRVFEVVEVP